MSHSQRLSGERAGGNDWNQGADRGVTIRFGACDGKTPNCVPITPGWNYLMRLYRPRAEIFDGSWNSQRRGRFWIFSSRD